MPLVSLSYAVKIIAFLFVGYISICDGAVICYPANNTLSVAECVVLYNDTLVLNASVYNSGFWYSNVSNSRICQLSTCLLENLSYKMSGIYTYHSSSGMFKINVTVLSPPYLSSCLEPSFKCGSIGKTCNQFLVDMSKTNYNHPRINVTVEGYGAANYSVKWYLNCSMLIQSGTNSSSWSYRQRLLSSNVIEFYLQLPLLLLDDMAGDYMAVISNAYGSNRTHIKVLIDRCYPQQKKPHAIQPIHGSSYQRVVHGQPTDVRFEVLLTPNADVFICINQSYNSKGDITPQCSKCPYNVDGRCTTLEDRSTWNVSLYNTDCLDQRVVTVHIPHVEWNDNVTIYLSSWVNTDDHSQGDIAHITLLVKSNLNIIEIILTVTAVTVFILVIIFLIVIGILCTRSRRKVRLRQMQAVLEEEENENVTDVVPNMSGYQSQDQRHLLGQRRQHSPSTGYGSYGTMDSCRSNDERDDEIATIHPPTVDLSLSDDLDSNLHQV